MAALVIAHLVDKDVIRYEQKIAEFWPAFGRNGKETITVEHVMTHRAGLVTFGAPISLEAARSPTQIAKLIEEAAPVWQPVSVFDQNMIMIRSEHSTNDVLCKS